MARSRVMSKCSFNPGQWHILKKEKNVFLEKLKRESIFLFEICTLREILRLLDISQAKIGTLVRTGDELFVFVNLKEKKYDYLKKFKNTLLLLYKLNLQFWEKNSRSRNYA